MTDINELVAKENGIDVTRKHNLPNIGGEMDGTWCVYCFQHIFSGDKNNPCVPDYLHDANLYMGLFEEMAKDNMSLVLAKNGLILWECVFGENFEDFEVGDTIGEAVCRAWLAWKGI